MDPELKKLVEAFKTKYYVEEEEEISEEETEVQSGSVFTDDFTDSLASEEKAQDELLANFIKELNAFAMEDVPEDTRLSVADIIHPVEKKSDDSKSSIVEEDVVIGKPSEAEVPEKNVVNEEIIEQQRSLTEAGTSILGRITDAETHVLRKRLTLQQVKRDYVS